MPQLMIDVEDEPTVLVDGRGGTVPIPILVMKDKKPTIGKKGDFDGVSKGAAKS